MANPNYNKQVSKGYAAGNDGKVADRKAGGVPGVTVKRGIAASVSPTQPRDRSMGCKKIKIYNSSIGL